MATMGPACALRSLVGLVDAGLMLDEHAETRIAAALREQDGEEKDGGRDGVELRGAVRHLIRAITELAI